MTTDSTGAEATVTEEPGRFTIAVDGTVVGRADFVDRGGDRIFPHTEVDEEHRGRGLASILVGEALRRTAAQGLRIVPRCSMVADYVARHPGFAGGGGSETP